MLKTLRFLLLAMLALGTASVAVAQGARAIPADALRGRFTPQTIPNVTIDGKAMRLAPGARIYSRTLSMLTPNQVKADTSVRYVLDAQGQIRTIWVVDERTGGTERTGPQQ